MDKKKLVTKSAYELVTGWQDTYKQDRAKQSVRLLKYKRKYARQDAADMVQVQQRPSTTKD